LWFRHRYSRYQPQTGWECHGRAAQGICQAVASRPASAAMAPAGGRSTACARRHCSRQKQPDRPTRGRVSISWARRTALGGPRLVKGEEMHGSSPHGGSQADPSPVFSQGAGQSRVRASTSPSSHLTCTSAGRNTALSSQSRAASHHLSVLRCLHRACASPGAAVPHSSPQCCSCPGAASPHPARRG
jgi:hypothetical protein